MIIQNGTIQLIETGAECLDPVTGFPAALPARAVGGPIPCQYSANKYDRLGMVDGEHFIVAQYSILVDADAIEDGTRLILSDRNGQSLGEFSIMQIEPLDAVYQKRILV